MQRKNKVCRLVWLLTVGILLALPIAAAADAYETWAGDFSFKRTRTEVSNTKQTLVQSKTPVSGRLEIYVIPNGPPTPDPEGYFIRFIDSADGFTVGIRGLKMVSTEVSVIGKPDHFLMVGAGLFFQEGNPVGPAYMTIKGTALKGPSGGMTAIKITNLTLGGGASGPPDFVWSGQGKATLTLALP